ncbi:tagatose 6-phosphate kinase [Streptoalloteichus tenebrarius]|uniref:Tagatose 6-phosphate kinase n=1 Tax=Streptoalloteichus tenebrarius (strain ATCC 17920 / DSM 40477 / JCM 4838 / CBS 697.72 / NBRC 16177 / NCIMB 11028 / NRRL B-12390 / A12253. 1 / ISP 5477) TaxID=1933 RepID=A0ABT1HQS5_STRSD|nr:1-phosphofructokinase family hexose kinase [Streptoalloteichus tenebrarius]MCP2257874.1 tagatose 6-phosphate kinase [Streptoalloteichus tenebrarius]BFE99763.1 1-phosphofructokinase family hexose kinase [Streptoalloteichus tenebrarius]
MILTVTLNAALDTTYDVDRLVPHASHRVREVRHRAGGKGVNVARVLQALGHPAVVTGFAGGPTGGAIHDDLARADLVDALVDLPGESRRTVTVVSAADGDATVFNEPGPHVDAEDWHRFLSRFATLARDAAVVVLSGSLPPGVPADAYAELTRLAAEHGARTIVDAEGEPLRLAVRSRPDVVKPNADELRRTTGRPEPEAGAALLRDAGARAVVASLGAEGMLVVSDQGAWRASPPERVAGNPTGAGDACVAALAVGLRDGLDWPATLREAVALSAAAVLHPAAGGFDDQARRRFLSGVEVRGLDGVGA